MEKRPGPKSLKNAILATKAFFFHTENGDHGKL